MSLDLNPSLVTYKLWTPGTINVLHSPFFLFLCKVETKLSILQRKITIFRQQIAIPRCYFFKRKMKILIIFISVANLNSPTHAQQRSH